MHIFAAGFHWRIFASVSEYAGVVWSGARFRGRSVSRVHRPQSSINNETDASANFERKLFGRFSFDSQKQTITRAANSSDFSETVRYFARSPTVRPSYLLSDKWQKSEEAVQKYTQRSTRASWQVHGARHIHAASVIRAGLPNLIKY